MLVERKRYLKINAKRQSITNINDLFRTHVTVSIAMLCDLSAKGRHATKVLGDSTVGISSQDSDNAGSRTTTQ